MSSQDFSVSEWSQRLKSVLNGQANRPYDQIPAVRGQGSGVFALCPISSIG